MKKTIIRTGFQKDSNGEFGELFLLIRDYIKVCIGNGVKEKHNEHTTSFSTRDGGYCSIRVKDEFIYINWFKGAFIDDKYKSLEGKGKVCRNLKVNNLSSDTRAIIRYYIQESFVKLLEHKELKIYSNL